MTQTALMQAYRDGRNDARALYGKVAPYRINSPTHRILTDHPTTEAREAYRRGVASVVIGEGC